MGGGENPTYSLIFSKCFYSCTLWFCTGILYRLQKTIQDQCYITKAVSGMIGDVLTKVYPVLTFALLSVTATSSNLQANWVCRPQTTSWWKWALHLFRLLT